MALEALAPTVVRDAGGQRGRGVFAESDIEEGDVIFTEMPLVAMQHVENAARVRVCDVCFRHVGSLHAQLRLLLGSDAGVADELVPAALPCAEDGFRACPEPHPCRHACGTLYCGAACEAAGWDVGHALLCPAAPAGAEPGGGAGDSAGAGSGSSAAAAGPAPPRAELLARFRDHALGSNEIFLLAAKASAHACARYVRARGDWEAAWEPFAQFEQPLWWEAVAFPADSPAEDEASFRAQMREVAAESWRLLRAALLGAGAHGGGGAVELARAPLLSDGGALYARLVGMFERNNCSVLVASPVEDWFLHIDALPDGSAEKGGAEAVSAPLLDALGEAYATPAEGTGLFARQAMLNHACEPNVSFVKRDDDVDGRVVLSAARAIRRGEELVHSYIDEGQPLPQRADALRDYGFVCECALCTRERQAEAAEPPPRRKLK